MKKFVGLFAAFTGANVLLWWLLLGKTASRHQDEYKDYIDDAKEAGGI